MIHPIAAYEVTVTKEDIDVLEHVNNRVYLRWIEEAAIYASDLNGWTTEDYIKFGAAWMAREHWIEYLRPCVLGDKITVYTWVEYSLKGRCLRRYAMKKGDKIHCVAATEWVFVDLKTRRAIDCPPQVAAHFEAVPVGDQRLLDLGLTRMVHFAPTWLPEK